MAYDISTIVNTEAAIEAAFGLPKMRISPRSKKVPSIDEAMKAVVTMVRTVCEAHFAEEFLPKLEDAYENYTLMEGERPDEADEIEAWEDGIDTLCDELLAPYHTNLSADWLGIHTIGATLHGEGALQTYAAGFGKEMYKNAVHGKTDAQILSAVAILKPDVEVRLAEYIANPNASMEKAMSNSNIDDVYAKIAAHIGKDHNVMSVYDDIDMTLDEDDTLAYGAGARLGLTSDEVETLRLVELEHGKGDAVDVIQQGIQAVLDAGKKGGKKVSAPKAAAAPKAPKVAANVKASASSAAVDYVEVLKALKATGEADTEMAKVLGVSRQTYINGLNGKSTLTLSTDQAQEARGLVVEKLNTLHEALGLLDGSEPHSVF